MRAKQMSKRFAIIILIIIFSFVFYSNLNYDFDETNQLTDPKSDHKLVRRLLSTQTTAPNVSESIRSLSNQSVPTDPTNCTTPAIEKFPYISRQLRKSWLMSTLSCLLIIYFFVGTALICDQYFVPSLEVICDKLKLEPDIAGSTFMAAGSSAPELSVALIGVFVAKDDIGVGTIVGSAVFNIAFVISICALFAGRVVPINKWPILRDSFFYLISICVLFSAMFDEEVSVFESIVFLVIYFLYILFMSFNKRIETKISNKFHYFLRSEETSNLVEYKTLSEAERRNATTSSSSSDVECIGINTQLNTNIANEELNTSLQRSQPNIGSDSFDNMSKKRQIWNILNLPLILIHWLTVPDCRQPERRQWFALTFFMSCVWISIYSYIIVWMITVIGFNLRIPDSVSGLVFIAAGASIPDAITSLIVVREGLGDMAVTNAIASNVFDILICLGLPWFLKTAIIDPGSRVAVISRGLEYSTISLLSTVVFFLVVTHLNGWKLTQKYGLVLMIWYFAFMVMASLYELNVFGQLNPPMCLDGY